MRSLLPQTPKTTATSSTCFPHSFQPPPHNNRNKMDYTLEFILFVHILKFYGYSVKVAFQKELGRGGMNPAMHASFMGYVIGLAMFSPAYVLHDFLLQQVVEPRVKDVSHNNDDHVPHDKKLHQALEQKSTLGECNTDSHLGTHGGGDKNLNSKYKGFNFFSTLKAKSFKGVFSRLFNHKPLTPTPSAELPPHPHLHNQAD